MSLDAAVSRVRDVVDVVRPDEPLAAHTTFRIGGPADLYLECDDLAQLRGAVRVLDEEQVEWTVIGKGSNLLVSDVGYRGAVIVLGPGFRRIEVDGCRLVVGGAAILAHVVRQASRSGLSGLSFAVGIPGTVGGAVRMNAGTRDRWMDGVVSEVAVCEPEGLRRIAGDAVAWGYRTSGLPARAVVVEVGLQLQPGDADELRREMEASLERRKRTQPLGLPNAGSIFVNPEGDSAGRLIEACGLKGLTRGGAAISDVHANFIVNLGGATAADVMSLIETVREVVKREHGVELAPEIRILGQD